MQTLAPVKQFAWPEKQVMTLTARSIPIGFSLEKLVPILVLDLLLVMGPVFRLGHAIGRKIWGLWLGPPLRAQKSGQMEE
jgi:hypothetical protein